MLALTTLLSGCGGATSSPPAVVFIDPILVPYSLAFQHRAADELEAIKLPPCPYIRPAPDCSAVVTMMEDYKAMRAEIRAPKPGR
jgi:hypothetical protein